MRKVVKFGGTSVGSAESIRSIGRILKSSHNMKKNIDVLQIREVRTHLLLLTLESGFAFASRQPGQIDVFDRRVSDPLGFERFCQAVQFRIGDVGRTDVSFGARSPGGGLHMPTREQVENGGLADQRKSDDSDPHAARPSQSRIILPQRGGGQGEKP